MARFREGDKFIIEVAQVHERGRGGDDAWYTMRGFDTPLNGAELASLERPRGDAGKGGREEAGSDSGEAFQEKDGGMRDGEDQDRGRA